ncbi:hypothetical protein COV04_02880 [Candidatus Uhrbacteria bacterium CG10_big_fil_rev_8_21_14_0_10_48_11]|uniref:Peptidase S8/S53 domain-containing protein n=1 Tax=Candidatus Uhrbacteria bacterium CG10_big_fil_rev_8_21_14_0_10_48_11 TaxID=1975037 RepID=A0A2M8LEI9_9BACT|nr:MAG: hypothetical protein COV04_02880 [Candidatus Uhrbacteria bacterium CG10_big_fil_rev_8_21_14_0_10_48_11]
MLDMPSFFKTGKFITTVVLLFAFFTETTLAAFDPNDIHYPQQWYLQQIGAPNAWETTTGGPDVVVAVLDTGVDIYHPDLRNNILTNPGEIEHDGKDNDGNGYVDDVHGWDFVTNSPDPRPDATPPFSLTALNHGTVVSGIIAAEGNNVEGIAGVTWHTRIMPLRVLDSKGEGDVNIVADAVDYAVNNGANVINLSFVGPGYSNRLYASLKRAYDAGVLVVVAAGNNNGTDCDLDADQRYPVCFDSGSNENWILGVAATDTLDQKLKSSNYGSCVDISAPGTLFYSTEVYDLAKGLTDAYGGGWSGTSVATPVVSGVAALIKAAHPALTNAQITNVILKSADHISVANRGFNDKLGAGRINASRAILGAASPALTPPVAIASTNGRIVTVAHSGYEPALKLFYNDGGIQYSWPAYDRDFVGGGGIAISENSRLVPEENTLRISAIIRGEQRIVEGEGIGGLGRLRILSTAGSALSQWYAFDRPMRSPINVASGNVFGDGVGSIMVAAAANGGPQIRVFDRGGNVKLQFFAYDKKLRGGFSVATADVNRDGKDEIIVSSTTLKNLPVRVFNDKGYLLDEWYPYPTYRGGVNVAAGDLDGDGRAEIVTAPVAGGGPQVRIFNSSGGVLGQFFVLPEVFRGGVSLSVGDVTSDGKDEIVIAPFSGGGPQVRIFTSRGNVIGQFFAYNENYRGGINVVVLR